MTKKEIQKYNIYLDEYYGNMEDLIEEHLMVMEESDGTKYAVVEKKRYIHQLVAMAFLGHTPNGHVVEVNHIDGDKLNNRLDNLEVLTKEEHDYKTYANREKFKSKYRGVSWNTQMGKWKVLVRVNGKQKFLGYFENEIEASETYQNYLKNNL